VVMALDGVAHVDVGIPDWEAFGGLAFQNSFVFAVSAHRLAPEGGLGDLLLPRLQLMRTANSSADGELQHRVLKSQVWWCVVCVVCMCVVCVSRACGVVCVVCVSTWV
jgi:hypothetical protein